MRNFIFILGALFFATLILAASVVRTTAKTNTNFKLTAGTPSPTLAPTPTNVDYYLPYPGILPDHFLYPLKMVRDRILLFLTTDPVKKAEVLLLFADKRLGASRALIEGGKTELGIATLTKAEKYLEQAVNQAVEADKQKKETENLVEKLTTAALKHLGVQDQILEKLSGDAKSVVEKTKEITSQSYQTIKALEEK